MRPGEPTNLSQAVWGISREGSGSHTMAFVLAKERGWPSPSFRICNDFATLRESLASRKIDAFLWEHFTTSPYAASGELDIVGGIPTPWGCFCAVMDPVRIDRTLAQAALHSVLERSADFETDKDGVAVDKITAMSGMTMENARKWHSSVCYARVGASSAAFDEDLLKAQQTVLAAGVISSVKVSDVKGYCV